MYIPLMGQDIRPQEMDLFRRLDNAVELVYGDMGGVSIRGSTNDTVELLKHYGYEPKIMIAYLSEFESRSLSGYYEDKIKEK